MHLAADSTIATLVNALLPRGGSSGQPSRALYLQVRISLNVYAPVEDLESSTVHLIFERPTNYTKVWSCVDFAWNFPAPAKFVMLSDHDSCWSTDGLRDVSKTYLNLLGKLRERHGGKRIDVSSFNCIDHVEWVGVTYHADPSDRHRKILTEIVPTMRLDGFQKV